MMIFIPFIVLFCTECLKVIIQGIKYKKFRLAWFLHSGGMPSGHSAFMSSVSTLVAYNKGLNSIEFLMIISVSLIIMYDARGVRATVGKHAQIINQTLLSKGHKLIDEIVGHSNLEVLVGACTGISLTVLLIKLMGI